MALKVGDVDYYEMLGISLEAEQSAIKKAYRKKALECHPDKNPDNPRAGELFRELAKAYELLSDAAARAAYDRVLKAKHAAQLRTRELDSKRRRLKEDLERREQEALRQQQPGSQSAYRVDKTDEERLQEELQRLREEGSKLLEAELRKLQEQVKKSSQEAAASQATNSDTSQYRLKLKWKTKKNDTDNGGYTQEQLLRYLGKYGEIIAFVMSKSQGSAMVEFGNQEAAEMAVAFEKGTLSNPLRFKWVTVPASLQIPGSSTTTGPNDFEDLVMRQLRQAAERKRLIEQMQREDDEEAAAEK